jgi:hypothetical protein
MTKDRLYLVATASAILAVLFAAILFPFFRSVVWWLLIVVACWLLLLMIGGIVLLVKFSRAVQGPKSLSGTRCPSCTTRHSMQEIRREFLHENVKFNFDHYQVDYRCTVCGHGEQQEELLSAQPVDDKKITGRNSKM